MRGVADGLWLTAKGEWGAGSGVGYRVKGVAWNLSPRTFVVGRAIQDFSGDRE